MKSGGKISKGKKVDNSIEVYNCTGEEQTPSLLFCQHQKMEKLSFKSKTLSNFLQNFQLCLSSLWCYSWVRDQTSKSKHKLYPPCLVKINHVYRLSFFKLSTEYGRDVSQQHTFTYRRKKH